MKKLLIIKPSYNFFPIGLAHVISALRKNNISYDYVDLLRTQQDWEKDLREEKYYAVATGGLTGDLEDIRDIAARVKCNSPETLFILGGKIVSDMPVNILFDSVNIDYAVTGEGEETLPELLQFLTGKKTLSLTEIHGLIFKDMNGSLCFNKERKQINLSKNDLHPYWGDIDIEHYIQTGVGGFPGFRAMPVLTGRGCTGKCTFCSPTNGSFRARNISDVINELEFLNENFEIQGFAFVNEIFYPTSSLILKFLEEYKRTGINKPWVCLLRVDLDESVMAEMKKAGCIGISYGAESGSDEVLKRLNKRTTVKEIKQFTRAAAKLEIPAFGSFMVGNEFETREELKQTFDLLIAENIAGPGSLVNAYPGTQIYKNVLISGRIPDEKDYVDNLDFSNVIASGRFRNINYMNISNMSDDALFEAVMEEFRRYYTHFYHKYQAEDCNLQNLSAICPCCKHDIIIPLKVNTILGMEQFCNNCFNTVYFNFYDLPVFRTHFKKLKEKLIKYDKIIIFGTGINANRLNFYDIFGLDYKKIHYYVCEDKSYQEKYFFNNEVISPEQLEYDEATLVVIADTWSIRNTTMSIMDKGFKQECILPLMPAGWLDFIKEIYELGGARHVRSLFEHGINQSIPAVGSDGFDLLVRDIGEYINKRKSNGQNEIMVMPAGEFAREIVSRIEKNNIKVNGFVDSYKTEPNIDNKPLYSPATLPGRENLTILLATPSYRAQQEMKNQLVETGLIRCDDIFMFGEIVLNRELFQLQ